MIFEECRRGYKLLNWRVSNLQVRFVAVAASAGVRPLFHGPAVPAGRLRSALIKSGGSDPSLFMRYFSYTLLIVVHAALLAPALNGCTPRGENETASSEVSAAIEKASLLRAMNSGNDGQWKDATGRIERAGPEAREFLLEALRFNNGGERSARIREYAARRLGQLKAPDVTVELCAALRDPDRFVSSEAATALTAINDPLAVPLIIEMLESTPRPESDTEIQMFEVLKKITGQIEGFQYRVNEQTRAEAIEKCKTWWAAHSEQPQL